MASLRVPIWKQAKIIPVFVRYWILVRGHLQHHWFFDLVQFGAALWAVHWWSWVKLPVPGYAIGVVALLAAVMSIHGDMTRWQKFIWPLLIGAFLFIEFRSIAKDRTEYADKENSRRIEESNAFQSIANEITTSIQVNQWEFDATISRIEHVAELSQQNLREITGGTGFPYVMAGRPQSGSSAWPLTVVNSNPDLLPLRNVIIIITELPLPGDSDEQALQKISNPWSISLDPFLPGALGLPHSVKPGMYQIKLRTRNNMFFERLRIVLDKGSPDGWKEESCLFSAKTGKLLKGHCD